MPSTSVVLFLLACSAGTTEVPECIDHGECAEGQACIADVCLDVDCMASAECDIGQYCNPETFACIDGCLADDDCKAGETCQTDTRTCEAYGCRSTELDCPAGSNCDEVTGECNPVDICGSCNVNNVNSCQGGPGNKQYCLPYDDMTEGNCYNECGQGGDCPSGFTCIPDVMISLLQYADICYADCPWLMENGYL